MKNEIPSTPILPKKVYPKRELKYPFVARSVVVLDPDWKWLYKQRFHYGCRSVSELIRRLVKLERKNPRKSEIVKMGQD